MAERSRGERITEEFSREPGPRMDCLLDAYDAALDAALELKPGASEALAAAGRAGRLDLATLGQILARGY